MWTFSTRTLCSIRRPTSRSHAVPLSCIRSRIVARMGSTVRRWARFLQNNETDAVAAVQQDKLACGPFVEVTSAYNSLNTQVRSISIVGYVSGPLTDLLRKFCRCSELGAASLRRKRHFLFHAIKAAQPLLAAAEPKFNSHEANILMEESTLLRTNNPWSAGELPF